MEDREIQLQSLIAHADQHEAEAQDTTKISSDEPSAPIKQNGEVADNAVTTSSNAPGAPITQHEEPIDNAPTPSLDESSIQPTQQHPSGITGDRSRMNDSPRRIWDRLGQIAENIWGLFGELGRGLWGFVKHSAEWICHAAAMTITAYLIQRSIRNQYWEDEGGWDSTWYFGAFDQGEVMKIFQFFAKGHELFVTLSTGFIVVRLAREQLVQASGIALGLLVSSHRIQSFENLLQERFRHPFFSRETLRHVGPLMVGVAIIVAALLVKLAGPSSAILMIPTLKWWPVDYIPGFPQMTIYVQAPRHEVFPLSLVDFNTSHLDGMDCESTHMLVWCPGSGWDTLNAWSWSQVHSGTPSNLTMPLSSDGFWSRPLTAYPGTGSTAVATTLHNGMSEALSFLWDLPQEAFNLTEWPLSWLAKRLLLESSAFAPVVSTRCGFRLQSDIGENDTLYFPFFGPDYEAVVVPDNIWKNFSTLDYPEFEWIFFSTDRPNGASLGALITLPVVLNGDEADSNPSPSELHQDWAYVPCISTAGWAPVSVLLDREASRSLSSNLTAQDAYTDTPLAETVEIGQTWANFLNVPGRYVQSYTGELANLSSIEALLWRQIITTPSTDPDGTPLKSFVSDWFYSNFYTSKTHENPDSVFENTAATILSLVLADGLSRVADWAYISVDTTPPGSSHNTFVQQGENTTLDYVYLNNTDIPSLGYYTFPTQASKYGWGWGLSKLVILALSILLTHVFVVLLYCVRRFFCQVRHTPQNTRTKIQYAPDDVGDLIIMALASPAYEELDAKVAESWRRRVGVETNSIGKYELVSSVKDE